MDETSKCCAKKNGRKGDGEGLASATSTTYGSMEVADNPAPGPSEHAPDMRAGGDCKDMELHASLTRDNDSIVWDPKPCNCVANGPKCHECLASAKSAVKVQMESWSVEKTVMFGIILGAFFIWAVVFGICLNVFKL